MRENVCGGNNAGHTIVVNGEKFATHLLPSGILTPGCTPVIANGVVVDAGALFREVDGMEARGVDTSRLVVSANAHLITSYHTTMDKVTERFLGKNQIGTTGRGIGPTYADKINRTGIRVADLLDEKILRDKVEAALDLKNQILAKVYNRRAIDPDADRRGAAVVRRPAPPDGRRHRPAAEPRAGRRRDGAVRGRPGHDARRRPRHLPVRDLQQPGLGRRGTGSGVGPTRIDRVIGVIKAYTTRVGAGPFPTELFDADGERLWEIGGEVGVSTGRNRRCGWYDAVVARYAARVNGLTEFCLTKLDVLGAWDRIPVCVAYDVDGERHDEMPMTQTEFHHAKPIYEYFDGWQEDISGCRTFEELPKNAQLYVRALEEMSGAPFWAVGVGPGREQTIVLREG